MKVKATLAGPAADVAIAAMGGTHCPRCGNLVGVAKPDEHYHLLPHPKRATWDGKDVASIVTVECEGSGEPVTPTFGSEGIAMSFEVPDESDLAEVERELNEAPEVASTLGPNRWVVTREFEQ